MKQTLVRFGVVLLVMVALLSGCQQSTPESVGTPADAALKVTGQVTNEVGWTEDEVRAMDTMDAESTNKDGETATYTGVSLNTLLDEAGVQEDATGVVFVADDDYASPPVSLDELRACAACIVSFRDQGGFSTVLPGFPGNVQVKGVVEIQVQ